MSQKTRWKATEQGCLKLTSGLHMYTHTYMYTYMHTNTSSLTDEEVRALQSLWVCDLSLSSLAFWKVGFLVPQGSQNSQNLTGYAHFYLAYQTPKWRWNWTTWHFNMNFNKIRAWFSSLDIMDILVMFKGSGLNCVTCNCCVNLCAYVCVCVYTHACTCAWYLNENFV